jgi:cyclopropane-fatty-acyl-phospholipid synthase
MLIQYMLKSLVQKGTLTLITADGQRTTYGTGMPRVAIKLHEKKLEWTLALNPEMAIPEAYMYGLLTIEEGDLREFAYILTNNDSDGLDSKFFLWARKAYLLLARFGHFNPLSRSRRNVEFHYDLPSDLYDLFLDPDRQYSCAYFAEPGVNLEQAQADKKRHIASKLRLDGPGLKILDIGSGWGGLGLYLAKEAGADVTGVTLSTEQYKMSRQKAQAAGLARACRFKLQDYRQETGRYDRIVSVGMFEHIGKRNYEEFFAKLRELLDDNGTCLLHTIGRMHGPGVINPFIQKYIFPGADLPALSEVTPVIERSGLYITDIEILRMHYAETLRHWYERFRRNRAKAVGIFGETFCRKWELYLAGCEAGFRLGYTCVFQIQLSKKFEAVPLTRDYMIDWEREHAADESAPAIAALQRTG